MFVLEHRPGAARQRLRWPGRAECGRFYEDCRNCSAQKSGEPRMVCCHRKVPDTKYCLTCTPLLQASVRDRVPVEVHVRIPSAAAKPRPWDEGKGVDGVQFRKSRSYPESF